MSREPHNEIDNVENLEARRREAAGRIETRPMSISAQIRALVPGKALMGLPPGSTERDEDNCGLPPFCPVKPLGRDGDDFFFLNAAGGVSTLTPSSAGKGHIDAVFAGQWNWLVWAWGQKVFIKEADGGGGWKYKDNYNAEQARVALFEAATRKGAWNMVDNVRGRGAWRGEDGSLVLHVGDALLIDGFMEQQCGEYRDKLYPMRPPTPRPAEQDQPAGGDSCGSMTLDLLKTWNWSRGELDAKLMLGWVCAAMVGGALEWRATVFLTGDKATGKSTLQKVVSGLLGGALISAVETTAAGIYQLLQNDSLPVAVDELEADADVRKAKAVVELARVASSGGRMLRGGQDHHGRQFDLRSPFLFSAINAPPLQPQDRSRMALLELKELTKMAARPQVDMTELRQTGRELMHRVCKWWPRLDDLLQAFREALMDEARGRHDGRGADTFGTLAAFAHIALSDDMPTEAELDQWARLLDARKLAEFEAATPNWKMCLRHVLQAQPDVFRTNYSRRSIASVLMAVRARHDETGDDVLTPEKARKQLWEVGVGLIWPKGAGQRFEDGWLFIPNDHPLLNKLFFDTKWQGATGGGGVWTTALRQSPDWNAATGEGVHRKGTGTVGGLKLRGTLISLASIFDAVGERDEDDPDNGGGEDDGD